MSYGKVAYEAYVRDSGGKSIRGEDLPAWDDQDPAIKAHWEAAGTAVYGAVIAMPKIRDH